MMNPTANIKSATATNAGFKQTEVGWIPVDWELSGLAKISTKLVVGFVGTCEPFFTDESGGVLLIRTGNLKDGRFVNENVRHVTTHFHEHNVKSQVIANDILIARHGDSGNAVMVPDYIKEANTLNIVIVRLNPDKINNNYGLWVINSNIVKRQVAKETAGSTQGVINTSSIAKLQIPLPPTLAEQTAIATALSDMDALIQAQEELLAKKRALKQGAMQELLRPKEGWVVQRLGEFVKFQVGYPFSSFFFNKDNKGIRLIKNRDLKSDDTIIYFEGEYLSDFIVKNGDVLIGMDGDFIPCYWSKGKGLLNQRIGRLKSLKQISTQFLFYYLQKPLKEIENRTSSTTVKHLSHGDIEEIELQLPNFDNQTHIAKILSDMDTEIERLEAQLSKYRQLKVGMMQELLTGKKRLV